MSTVGFAKGVSRTVSPRFFFFSEKETERKQGENGKKTRRKRKKTEEKTRKKTEENGRKRKENKEKTKKNRRKKRKENGKNRKRHRSGDPFCETPNVNRKPKIGVKPFLVQKFEVGEILFEKSLKTSENP